MPLYGYVCRSCGTTFELLRRFAERMDSSSCPQCKSAAHFSLSLSAPAFVGAATQEAGCSPSSQPGGTCCGGGACGVN
jgi:putative FmdB family regulatory protein